MQHALHNTNRIHSCKSTLKEVTLPDLRSRSLSQFLIRRSVMFKRRRVASTLLCLSLLATTGNAQIRSGTITGSALDTTGAAITDADVTVTNTGTNVSYNTKTNQAGLFTVPYLED